MFGILRDAVKDFYFSKFFHCSLPFFIVKQGITCAISFGMSIGAKVSQNALLHHIQIQAIKPLSPYFPIMYNYWCWFPTTQVCTIPPSELKQVRTTTFLLPLRCLILMEYCQLIIEVKGGASAFIGTPIGCGDLPWNDAFPCLFHITATFQSPFSLTASCNSLCSLVMLADFASRPSPKTLFHDMRFLTESTGTKVQCGFFSSRWT